ncbi:unnamed protein product, partial [Rotaria magnacalcarata]
VIPSTQTSLLSEIVTTGAPGYRSCHSSGRSQTLPPWSTTTFLQRLLHSTK